VLPGLFVTYEFMQRGTVRIPTAVLATGLVLSGLILMLVGVVLTALNRRFRELDYRLTLLSDDFGKDDRSDGRAAAPASADAGQGRPAGR